MDEPFSAANLVTAWIALNFATFAVFGVDKMLAEAGRRRIRESTLLSLAMLGGTPGAYAGSRAFRHKTRKQPFSQRLHGIAAVQVLALSAGASWMIGG